MQGENESEQGLLNRWENNDTSTLQTYMSKYPLLNDGAKTAGTQNISAFNGTFAGTFAGTFLLPANWPVGLINMGTFGTKTGTYNFTPQVGWAYVLHALTFSAVNPASDAGTLGTLTITGLRVNGESLGTLGNVANFQTLYGEDLTLFGSLSIGWKVELSAVTNGTMGTWGVTGDVSGWKFRID